MATENFDATTDPVDVVADKSLTAGTRYWIQNVDPAARLYFREDAAKPAGATLRGHTLAFGESLYLEPASGTKAWLWTTGTTCAAVVTEAF